MSMLSWYKNTVIDPANLSSFTVNPSTTPGFATGSNWKSLVMKCDLRDKAIEQATLTIDRADFLPIPIAGDTGAAKGQADKADAPTIDRKPDIFSTTIGPAAPSPFDQTEGKGSESEIITISGAALKNLKNSGNISDDTTSNPKKRVLSVLDHTDSLSSPENNDSSDIVPTYISKSKARRLAERDKHFRLY